VGLRNTRLQRRGRDEVALPLILMINEHDAMFSFGEVVLTLIQTTFNDNDSDNCRICNCN
jgi:hypothetical protein